MRTFCLFFECVVCCDILQHTLPLNKAKYYFFRIEKSFFSISVHVKIIITKNMYVSWTTQKNI